MCKLQLNGAICKDAIFRQCCEHSYTNTQNPCLGCQGDSWGWGRLRGLRGVVLLLRGPGVGSGRRLMRS